MIAEKTMTAKQLKDRHLLLAVDESENSKKALMYVADFLGGVPGFRVTLLRIIPEPPDDYFKSLDEKYVWIEKERAKGNTMLNNFKSILLQSGFRDEKVDKVLELKKCPSVADMILDQQKKLDCCTVVMGRRGISKSEEFLFGSASNKVMHKGANCAVWVIE